MSEQSASRRPFVSRQRVYFDMLDLMGMLHNAAYLLLFERARTDYWRQHQLAYGAAAFDWPYVVARNEIDYLRPIESECEVDVTVSVCRLGRSSVEFRHVIYRDDGAESARGGCVIVRIDRATGRSIPWSESFRELVAPLCAPEDAAGPR